MRFLRIALAQINTTVGDLEGNTDKIINFANEAKELGADLVVFPEMSITGYPLEDLILRADFIDQNLKCLQGVVNSTEGIAVVVGFLEKQHDVYNSAAFIYDGKIHGTYRKIFLPNYGVFDEKRYFRSGKDASIFDLGEIMVGINICEDIWFPDGPAVTQSAAGAGVILNLNASPYQMDKRKARERMIATRAADNGVYVAYVNSVGGQDELVFEGASMVFGPDGQLIRRGKYFEEDLILVDVDPELPFRVRLQHLRLRERACLQGEKFKSTCYQVPIKLKEKKKLPPLDPRVHHKLDLEEEIYSAIVLGVRDYARKNGFYKVVLGISGGIDSALVAAIAADALGPENVTGMYLPTRYSIQLSREIVTDLVDNLKIKLVEISIDKIYQHYLDVLSPIFLDLPPGIAEQNIQSRIRGNLIMAYSNKFNHLVLTTGNKSELAVGYATLYGDMAGGFAVLKDIPKSLVYRLAKYRNEKEEVIPPEVLTRAPTAELMDGQKDADVLPAYDILDPILQKLIEEDKKISEIIEEGFEEEVVRKVARMIRRNEFKRRQAPPGIKVTSRAFGRDRRFPITNWFRE